ncbi:MAG TPA: DUF6582 domain-containing protein [Gemmatimonadales bacterium]|nr:DUF6582 domain-containing protein [Gemmatimonadales bacterium]
MPLPLQRYWLAGKGAAKIRWNMPDDFLRCVRQLTKYFPKDQKGLCNILHTKATGGPPGHGSAEHSVFSQGTQIFDLTALTAAQELLDKQPFLGVPWAGPLAPLGRPTEEPRRTRILHPEGMSHRALPLPLDWRERDAPGHAGSVTVGRILGLTYGPDHQGLDFAWGWGDFLDPDIIPEARKAAHLVETGVAGASVDPGGNMVVRLDPKTGAEHVMSFTIGRATLVPIPAFSGTRLYSFGGGLDWPEDDPDMVEAAETDSDCGCMDGATTDLDTEDAFAVNPAGWRGLPLAPREAVFDNDDAVKRIAAWANVTAQGADVDKLRRAFLWYNTQQPPTLTTSYRLPVGDIVNGELTMIYHAVYAAAALLSGAHGGLPDVSEEDRAHLRNVISDIYPEMAKTFNDSSIRAPWDRSAAEGVQLSMDEFAATEPYGDVKYADPGYRDNKKRYPIDTPDHIRAAWAYINVPKNAGMYTDEQVAAIKAKIQAAAKKAGIEISGEASADDGEMSTRRKKKRRNYDQDGYAMTDTMYPVEPPKDWFFKAELPAKTPLTVTPEGQVYGHIAAWDECHRDFLNQSKCVLPPRSTQEYAPFHLGTVYTAEGEYVKVGKIVMDTRHADIGLGYTAAAIHYDHTGDEAAVVRATNGDFGVWVAGAVVPEATPAKVAKLRRSPISGDWRRKDGNLELTAALAVNVPAFPVYAMQDDEQTALVAAGTLEPYPEPPTGIDPNAQEVLTASAIAQEVLAEMARIQERDERAQRMLDLQEDEEIYAARQREARFAALAGDK